MIKKDFVRGRHRITLPAPLHHKNPNNEKQSKVIPLPVVERGQLMYKRFEKNMRIKEILDYMRENRLFPENPSQMSKKNKSI